MGVAGPRDAAFYLVPLHGHMPEMDSFSAVPETRRIAHRERTTATLLASGDRGRDLLRAREVGLKTYHVEPVKRQDLLNAILSTGRPTPSTKMQRVV